MGIIVTEAELPVGIKVSNVYMSFSGQVIYQHPRNTDGSYQISSEYKVYKDSTKTTFSNIKFPISVTVSSITNKTVYDLLYDELKRIYTDCIDCFDDVVSSGLLPSSG